MSAPVPHWGHERHVCQAVHDRAALQAGRLLRSAACLSVYLSEFACFSGNLVLSALSALIFCSGQLIQVCLKPCSLDGPWLALTVNCGVKHCCGTVSPWCVGETLRANADLST